LFETQCSVVIMTMSLLEKPTKYSLYDSMIMNTLLFHWPRLVDCKWLKSANVSETVQDRDIVRNLHAPYRMVLFPVTLSYTLLPQTTPFLPRYASAVFNVTVRPSVCQKLVLYQNRSM